jgi:hypothetical protein
MKTYDEEKVAAVVLALLYLTLHDGNRAWKGFDWDVLNRLYEQGWIENPRSKAKSVELTEKGLAESARLFEHFFGSEKEKKQQP